MNTMSTYKSNEALDANKSREQLIRELVEARAALVAEKLRGREFCEKLEEQRELVRNVNSAIVRWRRDGVITFFNRYAQELFGFTAEEAIGSRVDLIIPSDESTGDDLSGLVQDIVEHPAKHATNINENVCRDGRRIWMAWTNRAIFDENGEATEILSVGSDITEQKRVEQALRESERRWAVTLASIGDAVIATDTGGRIAFMNREAETLTGWESSEAVGKPAPEVFRVVNEHTREAVDDPVGKVLRSGMIVGLANHTVLLRKGGGETPIDDSAAPITDDDGRILGVVLVFRDISGRKATEEALMQLNETLEQRVSERAKLAEARAKQLQALTVELLEAEERERRRIARLLHDDLQQILASAKFQAEMLTESTDARTAKTAVSLYESLSRAIVASRTLSHELAPPFLRERDLVESLKKLRDQMEINFGLRIESDLELDSGRLGDDVRLFVCRTVQELLFNCAKHSMSDRAILKLARRGKFLFVTVADGGVGFDPSQLKIKGGKKGGIGLFSIQERAEALGGFFEIDSRPERGSRFVLAFPINDVVSDNDQIDAAEIFEASMKRLAKRRFFETASEKKQEA